MANVERSNWRDEELSKRHRSWGSKCCMMDIDAVYVEVGRTKSIALIEYKNEHAKPQNIDDWQYEVLKNLGDSAQLPAFAVRYKSDFSSFLVVPVNELAKEIVPKMVNLTEIEYVNFLYKLRGLNKAPDDVIRNLQNG